VSNIAAARSDDPAPSSDTPTAKFTELRTLLIGPEQRQLRALQTRLEDPAAQARDVSRVLATAVELRTNDPHLKRALAPTIEETIAASVRRNPRPLADALFPIIGPAIRKAIATTLSGMLESLNTTLEHSLSWRSLRWRLDARRTGKSFAEIVLLNTLVYRVEQVFLIHRPSGLLLQHLTAPGVAAQDPDLVSGMLTAIRDFVGDSFKVTDGEGLQALKIGELSVWVEQAPHALLAMVVRGTAPPALSATMQQALESVHAQYSDLLEAFDGNAARFDGARPLLEACFLRQYRERRHRARLSPVLQALLLLTVVALGTWLFFALQARSRWNAYVTALRSEPGVVVVSTGREGGKFVVRGLRDPLARDPAALLPPYNLAGDEVLGRWELYQALHPALVLARARQVLATPLGVNLQLEKDVLVASGTAPIDWIDASLRIAPAIAGVIRFDAGSLIDSSVTALARSIEDGIPMFVKGSTAFIPGGEQIVRAQIARLASLDALGRVARRHFTVQLVGEADADGPPEMNLPLSEHRATRVLSMLPAQSLEHVTFTAIGVGSRAAADPAAGEENKQRNRRVSFRITSTDRR
jgi:outer membrane protein OmpA-like peptidoglycan-associated protein